MSRQTAATRALPEPPPADALLSQRAALQQAGQRLVLTNGCFDLLHAGHIHFLQNARAEGDVLWVAVNADSSARELKGPARPVQSAPERAFGLSALRWVDKVFTFEGVRCPREISLLRPDIYVKAGDYTLDTLDPSEREALLECGAEVRFLPFLEGFSTTNLIAKIHAAYRDNC